MNDNNVRNGLQDIIDEAMVIMGFTRDETFDSHKVNLAEFSRITGLSRSKARTLQTKEFVVTPHGRYGYKAPVTVLTGYTGILDDLLKKGVTNSEVCFERIKEQGYQGGLTTVKDYLRNHAYLVPAKRKLSVEPQGNRGRRFQSDPGESFQMDWGFVNVVDKTGFEYRIACFAMICHHCGYSYIEFFTNARQENLFIGMIHAFLFLGIPEYVLTDNMKSIVIGRDHNGHPNWNTDYEAFMNTVGFKTKLCKPRHPFTKGRVERLVRFVKDNFLAGREFSDLTDLNNQALDWCIRQGSRYHRASDCVPANKHTEHCLSVIGAHSLCEEALLYTFPVRTISFDGFISYEGRRFGVPFWYEGKLVRVNRDRAGIHIYSEDLQQELVVHELTWSKKDSFCEDQYATIEPVELPSAPVTTYISQIEAPTGNSMFDKFDFERCL